MAGEIEPMTSEEFKGICIAAIDAGQGDPVERSKGMLKAKCPKSDSDGAAAWQAMTLTS
jgi:hypothetical protein